MSTDADSATTRREVLQRAAALGLVVGGVGCPRGRRGALRRLPSRSAGGRSESVCPAGPAAPTTSIPHLEGVAGFAQAYRQIVYSKLTDMRPNGSFAGQLAESMTPNKDATALDDQAQEGDHLPRRQRAHRRRRDLHLQADPRSGEQAQRGQRQHRHDRSDRHAEGQQVRDDREADATLVRPSGCSRAALHQHHQARRHSALHGGERQRNRRVQAHVVDARRQLPVRCEPQLLRDRQALPQRCRLRRHLRLGGARQRSHLGTGRRDQRRARSAGRSCSRAPA